MRLGVLGGTFDPVHNGHLRLAIESREALQLDEVVLEVAAVSPFKTMAPQTDMAVRLLMVQKAVSDTEGLLAGDTELHRQPPSFTVDTIAAYRERWADVWLILGADALEGLPDWKDPDRLLSFAESVVGLRPGEEVTERSENSHPLAGAHYDLRDSTPRH
jgi:nicotinate-nucleotide adenylyltransferase